MHQSHYQGKIKTRGYLDKVKQIIIDKITVPNTVYNSLLEYRKCKSEYSPNIPQVRPLLLSLVSKQRNHTQIRYL